MPSEPAQQAAAEVISDLMVDPVAAEGVATMDAIMPDPSLDAGSLIPDEAPEAQAEGEQPQEDELEIPEINWETPEELQAVFDAPDFDEEEEVEEFEGEGNVQPTFTEDEYDDPEKAQLKKQLAKANKKLAWENEQRVKAQQGKWADEARKYYQFCNPELIQAKSRRNFLKQAEAQHMAVAKVAKPVFDQLSELKAKAKAEALAEARAEAEQRWGAPTSGPTTTTTLENTQTVHRERLQQGQSLTNVIKAKLIKGQKDGNPLL